LKYDFIGPSQMPGSKLRVLIAGGGTGGHVYPGIAIAKEIRRRHPESAILFVGTARGLESRIVLQEGFGLETITVSGLKGIKGLNWLKGMATLPLGIWDAFRINRRFRPDVVMGVGGYSSGPPVLTAALMGIPTMLQEQNAYPGLTNRLLALVVKRVATAFIECERFFGKKAVLTGNPVRSEFKRLRRPENAAPFTVLIFGGSQGAHAINQAMAEALPVLQESGVGLIIIHQTGERDYAWLLKHYQDAGFSADIRPFFNDMPCQFEKADLIISRAGATTLAELMVAGKAAILVPFPQATDNHQQKNAEALQKAGAAEMIMQPELQGAILAKRIQFYQAHRDILKEMEEKSRHLGHPEATERIVDLVEGLIHV
jgi:UDP-N-acetylglucosamine--N-acetylmuramyl-(pentapeptide) pyrophosphoryl-undecaprenol N-acetylglucosamine transferase